MRKKYVEYIRLLILLTNASYRLNLKIIKKEFSQMKKLKSIFALLSVGIVTLLISACSMLNGSSDARQGYDDFKANRPEVTYEACPDESINEVAKEAATLYGQTITLLDDYMACTEGNRTYMAFNNDIAAKEQEKGEELTEQERQDFFNTLTPEQQQEILSVKKLEGFNNLKRASEFLTTALALSAKSATMAQQQINKFQANPFGAGADVIAAKGTATTMLDQAKFSVEALQFMVKQYTYVQRLKSHSGR